jgi:hypothetical protein
MKTVKILALSCVLLNLAWTQSAMARGEEVVKAIKDYYENYSEEKDNICHAIRHKSKIDFNNKLRTDAGLKPISVAGDSVYEEGTKALEKYKDIDCSTSN